MQSGKESLHGAALVRLLLTALGLCIGGLALAVAGDRLITPRVEAGLVPAHVTGEVDAAASGPPAATVERGDPTQLWIALTFDDGPHPVKTEKLLAILNANDVRATFFVVGKMAKAHPELIKAEAEAGDSVENHSYTHPNLTKLPLAKVASELSTTAELITNLTGHTPRFMRPPGEDYNAAVLGEVRQSGEICALDTLNAGDYEEPGAATITSYLLGKGDGGQDRVKNGTIILLHDGVQDTMDALPEVITTLKARGFRFVTLDEMFPAGK